MLFSEAANVMSDFSAKTHIFLDYGLFDRLVAEKNVAAIPTASGIC